MSAEIVALLVLAAAVAAAVAFTIIVVVTVERSTVDARPPHESERAQERENEER